MNSNRNYIFERDTDSNSFNSRINIDGYNSGCNNSASDNYFGRGISDNYDYNPYPNNYNVNNAVNNSGGSNNNGINNRVNNQSTWNQGYNNSYNTINVGKNHYIEEHIRNKAGNAPQINVDSNRKTVKSASVIASDRRVTNNPSYNYDNSIGYNNGYGNAMNDLNKPIAKSTNAKSNKTAMPKKKVVYIAIWSLILVLIATMLIISCLPSANAQPDNGQNSVNVVYDESVLNKYIDSEGNVHDINSTESNPSYKYDTKTNWFDKLCDWMEKIGG